MGKCPYCEAEITVKAELVPPSEYEDDNVAMSGEGSVLLEQGVRVFQYVCPECDMIVGAGTHKWAK